MSLIFKLYNLLNQREKKKAFLLILMILIMAILETAGVVSILPFLTILSNPELIETNKFLNKLFVFSKIFGIQNNKEFFLFLGIVVFFIFTFSLIFKAFTTYVLTRFTRISEYTIGKRLVESYLHQPYSWFLNKHSADLGKNILSEVFNVIERGMGPLFTLLAQSVVVLLILIVLLIVDVVLATTLLFSLGFMYLVIYLFMNSKLKRLGIVSFKANEDRFTTVVEAFGAAKEVKVGGLEQFYITKFSSPALIYAKKQASVTIIGQLPKYLLEGLGFGGILIMVLYLISVSGSFSSTIPIVTLYAFAGYRLLPGIQQIYQAFTSLRFSGPAIDSLFEDVKNIQHTQAEQKDKGNKIELNEKISLKNIDFSYPNSSDPVLKNVNIKILSNERIGIVGPTGCGKTTLIDLILGLLEPNKGTLNVDGKIINKSNFRQWQANIGYVPQHIYLADQTISQNIAFGVEESKIDQKIVEKVSKSANLHNFICEELPFGYNTKVGERGIRLSGGQRQRIGIARAIYHNPQVLIMDEATSALDNITEQAVMDALNNLKKNITVILIAHRLNTVIGCDKIFIMEKGEIISEGNYEQLFKNNKYFREMVNTK